MADGIEHWGRAHRGDMTATELEDLADVWRTIKRSSFGELEFRAMTKGDAQSIMALFEQPKRGEISRTLNTVRRWSLAVPILGGSQDDVVQIDSPRTAGSPSGSVPIVPIEAAGSGAVNVRSGMPERTDGAMQTPLRGSGPVEGWEPPTGGAATTDPISNRTLLIAVGAAALVALLVWALFIRGGESDDGLSGASGDSAPFVSSGVDEIGAAGDPALGSDSTDFCTVARSLDEIDPFAGAGLDSFGPSFFDDALVLLSQLTTIAPSEITADLTLSTQQLAQMRAVSAEFDFNLADPALVTALNEMDTTDLDLATERLDGYFLQVCGIGATGGS